MYVLKNESIVKGSILLILVSLVYACHSPNSFDSNGDPIPGSESDTLLVVKITGGIAGVNGRVVIQQSGLSVSTDLFQSGAMSRVHLAAKEIEDLNSLMLDNDFFQLEDRYVNKEVADAFFYEISFTAGKRNKTVITDYFGAPDDLQKIVDGLNVLINRILDNGLSVLITDLPLDSIQLDSFSLNSVAIEGDRTSLNISHGGGCEKHDYDLFMSPAAFLESIPVQANLYLQHEDNDDLCEAWINTTLVFDLRPIAELHQRLYGRPADEIIINVFKYFQNVPVQNLSASYFPSKRN
jgi:hypothetical protein